MPEGERKPHIPRWAERERLSDMAWIAENLQLFWSVAQAAYAEVGRGAIVADTTVQSTSGEHPFGYVTREAIVVSGDSDAIRMVAQYEPDWQFVALLLKSEGRVSTYRIGVPNQQM